MPKRRTSTKPLTSTTTQHDLTATLRRSQRLLYKAPQDLHSISPNTTRNRKDCTKKFSKELIKSDEKSSICAIPVLGYRRSPRLSNRAEGNSSIRRSPRLALLKNCNAVVQKSDNRLKRVQVHSLKKSTVNSSKKKASNWVPLNKKDGEEGANSCNKIVQRSERITQSCVNFSVVIGLEAAKRRDLCEKNQETKATRKRKRGEECNKNGSVKGWTREQEMALQRAYLVAKPTPNFWKQVSKLVPGKSAQDCFDRIHLDHLTPPQQLPRTRAKRMKSSPVGRLSLSASNLISPSGLKVKGLISNKPKSHIAQKTIRQLLQKHNCTDQNYEADLFSILEPNVNPSRQESQLNAIVSTPKHLKQKQGFLQKCHERSSSGQKKSLSWFRSLHGTDLVSPPVLKQVKNRALHEKYIDQLHCREAKRMTAFVRAVKENNRQVSIQKTDAIRAAKNALVTDARDAINKIHHLRANANGDSSDINDDDFVDSDVDEYDGF